MDVFSYLSDTDFSGGKPVMKNVISSPKFNVVRVCSPAGLTIDPHPEPNATFFLVIEGSGIFTKRSQIKRFVFLSEYRTNIDQKARF